MMAAMASFTLNDTAMKSVTETLPLYETIFLRGVLTVVALWLIGIAQGGLRLRFTVPIPACWAGARWVRLWRRCSF